MPAPGLKSWLRTRFRHIYRNLRHPRLLKKSRWRQHLSRFVMDRKLWRFDQNGVSKGVGVGLLVFLLPLPLPQMLLATLICCWKRWNIPVAVATTWISNPVTMVPLYVLYYNLGKSLWMFLHLPAVDPKWQGTLGGFVVGTLGGLPVGAVLGYIGYQITYHFWGAIDRWIHKPDPERSSTSTQRPVGALVGGLPNFTSTPPPPAKGAPKREETVTGGK